MQPMPQLIPLLKQLRLSGILDSIESRNRQAIAEQLSYLDFLSFLVQDELARREQKKFSLRYKRASFQGDKTIENFDFQAVPTLNRQMIQDLISCRFVEENSNILIVGPCGTGKSHVAQAIGNAALRNGYDVLFIKHSKLLSQMQAAKGTGTLEKRLAQLADLDVLIIDDFALRPMEPKQEDIFHELISERYERRPTIVTMNVSQCTSCSLNYRLLLPNFLFLL
jgi:DNA replication protein DnaC